MSLLPQPLQRGRSALRGSGGKEGPAGAVLLCMARSVLDDRRGRQAVLQQRRRGEFPQHPNVTAWCRALLQRVKFPTRSALRLRWMAALGQLPQLMAMHLG